MEKVIEAIEPEFDKMCATCGLPAVYLTEDGVCLSSREFIYRLCTDLVRTKKALELANEGLAHYADAQFWCPTDACVDECFYAQPGNGYDKARETQKEIEKLLGGDR